MANKHLIHAKSNQRSVLDYVNKTDAADVITAAAYDVLNDEAKAAYEPKTYGGAKLPDASRIEYGELAVNYAEGFETISLKNSNNDIVEFPSKGYVDTKYTDFTGANGETAGTHGLVPAPAAADNNKFLKGDGTWGTVSTSNTTVVKLDTVTGTKKTDGTLITADSTSGLKVEGGTNLFKIGDGTNYIEVDVTPSIADNVTGSGLTAEKIALGNGNSTVKTSGVGIKTSANSGTLDTTSDTEVPTSKVVSSYVTGLGYTTNTGDVTGPNSSTANHVATFSDATGKVVQDSGYTIATSVPSGALFTDTNDAVTQTASSTNSDYEVLFSYSANNTTETNGTRKNSNLKFNPSTGNLQTTKINGATVGNSPVFDGTKVTLNDTDKSGTTASFYAPTTVGTTDQLLASSGSGAPTWQTQATTTDISNLPLPSGTDPADWEDQWGDKADKVENAVAGNFAGLDIGGNLIDSGKNASDFAATAKDAEKNVTVEANTAPTSSTTTYVDALNQSANHIVGDKRIVPNASSESGYDTYILLHLASGVATWNKVGAGVDDSRIIVVVRTWDNDDTNLALTTASITVNSGTATSLTGVIDTVGHKKTFTATGLEVGDLYTITFGSVTDYTTPAPISGTKDVGASTYNVTYQIKGLVDLGLTSGTLWESGNICKDGSGNYYIGDETDYGCLFSWGNVDGHNRSENFEFGPWNYWNKATYDTVNPNNGYPSEYFIQNNTPGATLSANISSNDSTHDAALATLGSPFRLPTVADFEELIAETDSQWVSDYNNSGVNGYLFMKRTDHSVYIFMPATGGEYWYYDTETEQKVHETTYSNVWGAYWSSSFYDSWNAYYLYFNGGDLYTDSYDGSRYDGFPVRAVQ